MLKLLLKKQLLEIFQVYYYDAKKNKARSKVSTVLHFLLFALLIFGLLGGIFTFLAVKLYLIFHRTVGAAALFHGGEPYSV